MFNKAKKERSEIFMIGFDTRDDDGELFAVIGDARGKGRSVELTDVISGDEAKQLYKRFAGKPWEDEKNEVKGSDK